MAGASSKSLLLLKPLTNKEDREFTICFGKNKGIKSIISSKNNNKIKKR